MNLRHLISQININISNNSKIKNLIPIFRKYYIELDNKELSIYKYMLEKSLNSQEDYNKFVIYANHEYELNLINWGKNSKTKLHGHPENGCLSLLINGNLKETQYNELESKNSIVKKIIKEGDINYIDNSIYHIIENNNSSNTQLNDKTNSLSLHLYSPPNIYFHENVLEYNIIEGSIKTDNKKMVLMANM